jgi:flagellar protein FliJ
LLRLREATRDGRRLELAEACRVDDELLDQQNRLRLELRRLLEECREAALPGEINVNRLAELHGYFASLRMREDDLRNRRRESAEEIERRRQALVEADQNVQVLEKLREHRLDRHRADEQREESKHLDEMALLAGI